MQFRLMLDRDQVDRCRKMAREIAVHLERYSSRHTSLSIEDASLRALGVHGEHKGRSLPEVVLDAIGRERLREGAPYWLGAVMVARNCTPLLAAKHIAKEGLPERKGEKLPHGEIRRMTRAALAPFLKSLDEAKSKRQPAAAPQRWGADWQLLATLHTGNVDDDVKRVQELMKHPDVGGATVQSPLPANTAAVVGRGRGWRAKYDAIAAIERLDRLVREHQRHHKKSFALTWDGCSLAGPLMAVAVATSHLASMAYDCCSLVGVTGVHLKRAIVDQAFVYRLFAKSGVGVAVASDRWRSAVNGYSHGHELLMGQLLIEAMGERAGIALDKMAPCHGLVIPRDAEHVRSHLLDDIAHAQLVRELFPQVPLGFAVPTAPAGDIVMSTMIAALCGFPSGVVEWNETKKMTAQGFRATAAEIANARQLVSDLGSELAFVNNGQIARRSSMLVEHMARSLQQMHRRDLLQAVPSTEARGLFNAAEPSVGLDGVFQRHKYYWNPLLEWLA